MQLPKDSGIPVAAHPAVLENDLVYASVSKYGTLLFYRNGNRIRTEGKYGKVVFTVQGSIPLPILIWISMIN